MEQESERGEIKSNFSSEQSYDKSGGLRKQSAKLGQDE
jgi:hypothetical protein